MTDKEDKHKIEFVNTGETVYASERQTILDACLDEGISQEYSCRVGMCLACVARIEKGEVKQPGARGLSDKEMENYALTCMARAQSDLVLERGVYPPSIDGDTAAAIGDGSGQCQCEKEDDEVVGEEE